MNETQVSVPLPVRLRFGHAAIQRLADSIGVDLLHIKGAAVDPSLRPPEMHGTDVDVMVRPAHFERLDTAMRTHGWRLYTTFESGSPFGHAQTYLHDTWGYIDIHRFFPGIRLAPEAAFDRLWSDRTVVEIAGTGCPVPAVASQALLLILNCARAGGGNARDLDIAWKTADDERRREIEDLVRELDAPVGFAAAVGGLDAFRGERDYRLWKAVTQGGTRSEEWWGRVRAAPALTDAARIVMRAALVNVDHLEYRLGRRPNRREITVEFFARPVRAMREAWHGLRRWTVR